MAKNKNTTKEKKHSKSKGDGNPQPRTIEPNDWMRKIFEKRLGGSLNIGGLSYQIYFACSVCCSYLFDSPNNQDVRITFEGIEDIDLSKATITGTNENNFVQVKHSSSKWDASDLWSQRVIQNFLEAYLADHSSKFTLVYDMQIATGNLKDLVAKKLTNESRAYWNNKIDSFRKQTPFWHWSGFQLDEFLNNLSFRQITEKELEVLIRKSIIERFEIHSGNEKQYLMALYFNVLQWSRKRCEIGKRELIDVFDSINEDFSKGTKNPAVEYEWISLVDFKSNHQGNPHLYYQGKAATPGDIGLGLPASRPIWKSKVIETFNNHQITVIKASSGQGKSTLLWQAAMELKQAGFDLFQLHWLRDEREIGSVIQFLNSKVSLGYSPVVVIDNLDDDLKAWIRLAERVQNLPISFLVSAREQDWQKLSPDRAKLDIGIVDVRIDQTEAKDIYRQFDDRNLLYSEIKNWQWAWEQVQASGLLIEFIFLITQGTHLSDRISHQVKKINQERDAAAKIELLRVVAMSDVLAIKLDAQFTLKYLENRFSPISDRGMLISELEKEFLLKVSDNRISGLHPVRSRHLLNELHSYVPIQETLERTFSLIPSDDYFQFAHNILEFEEKLALQDFYDAISVTLATSTYSAISEFIRGTFSGFVEEFLSRNKPVYDKARNLGAFLYFVGDSIPWENLKTCESIAETLGDQGENLRQMAMLLKEIKYSNEEDSAPFYLLNNLASKIKLRPGELKGIGTLLEWFDAFKINPELAHAITKSFTLMSIRNGAIKDSRELAKAFRKFQKDEFDSMLVSNMEEILAIVKKKTDTPYVNFTNGDLSIKYILYEKAGEANTESVERIKCFSAFFPDFENYCTNAISPPIPGSELFNVVLQNAQKRMPASGIPDEFKRMRNTTFMNTIMAKYECQSVFEWLDQWKVIRQGGIRYAQLGIRFLEAILEGSNSRVKAAFVELQKEQESLSLLLRLDSDFPGEHDPQLRSNSLKDHFKAVTSWGMKLLNVVNQFFMLIKPPDSNSRNLVHINSLSTFTELSKMQFEYSAIQNLTTRYFETEKLEFEESILFRRLEWTIEFFNQNQNLIGKIPVAKPRIEEWSSKKHLEILRTLEAALQKVGKEIGLEFFLPTSYIREGNLKTLPFGIDITYMTIDQFWEAILPFLPLLNDIKVDFFVVVLVSNGESGSSIRFSHETIDKLVKAKLGENWEYGLTGNFLPIPTTSEMVSVLKGIELPVVKEPIEDSETTNVAFSIWKAWQYHQWIDQESSFEKKWCHEIALQLKSDEEILEIVKDEDIARQLVQYRNYTINTPDTLTIESFQELFSKIILKSGQL